MRKLNILVQSMSFKVSRLVLTSTDTIVLTLVADDSVRPTSVHCQAWAPNCAGHLAEPGGTESEVGTVSTPSNWKSWIRHCISLRKMI